MDTLLTPAQTAQILGIQTGTLQRWRNKRKPGLPWVRVGHNSVRYRSSDIETFIRSRVTRAEPKQKRGVKKEGHKGANSDERKAK